MSKGEISKAAAAAPAKPEAGDADPAKPETKRSVRMRAAARSNWRRRWLIIRLSLGFCAATVLYVILFGPDDRLRETALLGAFSLAGAVTLGYLGFAAQDDAVWLRFGRIKR